MAPEPGCSNGCGGDLRAGTGRGGTVWGEGVDGWLPGDGEVTTVASGGIGGGITGGAAEPVIVEIVENVDQGPVVLMIENYRTGLVWDIMRRCPYVVAGLRRAGFAGGWL